MKNLLVVTLLFGLAHALTWVQMNTQFIYPWIKKNLWVPLLFAIPIGFLFIKGVQYAYDEYNEIWPARIIGFCIGNIVFAVMTYLFMNEGINLKTIISLGLSLIIILIQVLWK